MPCTASPSCMTLPPALRRGSTRDRPYNCSWGTIPYGISCRIQTCLMMLYYLVILFFLATKTTSQAVSTIGSQNKTFVSQEIAKISPCGLSCLIFTVPEVGCSLLNTTCQCLSTKLVSITSTCMYANCTLQENLALAKVQAAICERPNDSKAEFLKIMTIACTTITNAAVLLRIASRLVPQVNLGLDDVAIIVAAMTDGVFTYFGVLFEQNGFGEHIWNIHAERVLDLLFWFYICEIFYVATIGVIKMSILFFYLRVFPKPIFRRWCWMALSFCTATTVIFVLVSIFQCGPIPFAWNKDIKNGKCVNYNTVAWVHAGMNILQDIILVLLPVGELRKLQLKWPKRLGLYTMFGLGSIVCILSMVRLNSLKNFGLTADPTYDNVSTTFWSKLESTTAFVAACIPAIRAGCVNLFHKASELTTGHTSKDHLASSHVYIKGQGEKLAAPSSWGRAAVTNQTTIWSDGVDSASQLPESKNDERTNKVMSTRTAKPKPPPIKISNVMSESFGNSGSRGLREAKLTLPATASGALSIQLEAVPSSSPRSIFGLRLHKTATILNLSKSLPPTPSSISTSSPHSESEDGDGEEVKKKS